MAATSRCERFSNGAKTLRAARGQREVALARVLGARLLRLISPRFSKLRSTRER